MKRLSDFFRLILKVFALAAFVLVLVLIIQTRPWSPNPGAPLDAHLSDPYPLKNPFTDSGGGTAVESLPSDLPYPPPSPPPSNAILPSKVQALLDQRSKSGDAEAVTLVGRKIWYISLDSQVETLTEFTDVSVLYGWNYDGSKLLFGRGSYETQGELAKSTELWIYDLQTRKSSRLVDSTRIWAAVWSPVDDRVAFCEWGETPIVGVVSLDGGFEMKRENLFWDMAWSPDGSALAVSITGPDMVTDDTRFTALGVWWLEKDQLQVLSDTKNEFHGFPLWLVDGREILFMRLSVDGSVEPGFYLVDVQSGKLSRLESDPGFFPSNMTRSPRENAFIFSTGGQVYLMSLGDDLKIAVTKAVAKGRNPVWYPDGKTIIYTDSEEFYQTAMVRDNVGMQAFGGGVHSFLMNLQPDIYFDWR